MFWQEDEQKTLEAADTIQVLFKVEVEALPVDHMFELSQAVLTQVPYMATDPCAGIHVIYGAESGNGWERSCNNDDLIYPSKRTQFTIQAPRRLAQTVIDTLDGFSAKICGYDLRLSAGKVKAHVAHGTVLTRHMVLETDDENELLEKVFKDLQGLNIKASKMMCGKPNTIRIAKSELKTRSLMIADLQIPDALLLQSCGLGEHKLLGCGLFLPHKAVEDTWNKSN